MLLYWQIGREILAREQGQGWGKKIIPRLADDLRQAFPEMRGFSQRNLTYMRDFASAWPEASLLQEALATITWYHNITLLDKLRIAEERLWYAMQAVENGRKKSA
ncbi:MAG TPA: DUF1016 N-terminal domain-containing protein [Armatimonadota bacterium]